ncbi:MULTISPECIES: DUF6341 family protein [Nonlabens]|uniref:Uracil phosphoribosyltransferase n=3 Tax=Nonlabens TaxID=363408 RepID=A0A081D7B8_NONUL|nr:MULTISPECIES: hypothetical protein [Nonlabens]MBF4984479.1 uracil phosphoribosyltransferase [Nonlabens mediterrranea]KEZ92409.1 uracil phosphoribosyltransferase [Nonlabens ulvanivorans]PQJ31525.1 uracil phosphoribosyltransferase [Nonlabens arenilitoris]PRX15245.1 hypothetical protein LY02_00460 [Nonlabens ulvanivorans]WOI22405.1 uracil phosphoribosyltransferase [Nonlabens ulvanivorans]|tara:strand:+ start:855 stop:1097 length:243 start_codon:yes stop_codon:yes gene_type:complete
MKEFFEGIAYFFEEILLAPFSALAELELENWWLANTVSWICIAILIVALGYWIKQLRIFEANGEEDHTQTAHSFLGKNQK